MKSQGLATHAPGSETTQPEAESEWGPGRGPPGGPVHVPACSCVPACSRVRVVRVCVFARARVHVCLHVCACVCVFACACGARACARVCMWRACACAHVCVCSRVRVARVRVVPARTRAPPRTLHGHPAGASEAREPSAGGVHAGAFPLRRQKQPPHAASTQPWLARVGGRSARPVPAGLTLESHTHPAGLDVAGQRWDVPEVRHSHRRAHPTPTGAGGRTPLRHGGHVGGDGLRTPGSGPQGLWKRGLHDTAARHVRHSRLTLDAQPLALPGGLMDHSAARVLAAGALGRPALPAPPRERRQPCPGRLGASESLPLGLQDEAPRGDDLTMAGGRLERTPEAPRHGHGCGASLAQFQKLPKPAEPCPTVVGGSPRDLCSSRAG